MTRTDTTRSELLRKVRTPRFQPFALNVENGDRIIVEHPENVAFHPKEKGSDRVFVISEKLGYSTTLSAITSMAVIDRGEPSS